jgi:hypothetical protein
MKINFNVELSHGCITRQIVQQSCYEQSMYNNFTAILNTWVSDFCYGRQTTMDSAARLQ